MIKINPFAIIISKTKEYRNRKLENLRTQEELFSKEQQEFKRYEREQYLKAKGISLLEGQWEVFNENRKAKNKNLNISITGNAGTGKTFLIQEFISQAINQNKKTFIIDDSNSFTSFINFPSVEVIKMDKENGINPFSLISEDHQNQSSNGSKKKLSDVNLMLEAIVSNIYKPLAYEKYWNKIYNWSPINKKEKDIISLVVGKTINDFGNKGNFKKLSDNFVKIFNSLQKEEREVGKRIQKSLNNFLKENPKFFKCSVVLENKTLTIFDVKNLIFSQSLKSVATTSIMNLIEKTIIDNNSESYLVIDDIRYATNSVTETEYLYKLSKKLDKYNSGVITSVQHAGDYYQNKYAKKLFQESNQKIFLEQRLNSYKPIPKELSQVPKVKLRTQFNKTPDKISVSETEGLININNQYYLSKLSFESMRTQQI